MKIAKKQTKPVDKEIPSTIVVRSSKGSREYWTGSTWADDLGKAKRYLRRDAEKRATEKHDAWIITIGFRK